MNNNALVDKANRDGISDGIAAGADDVMSALKAEKEALTRHVAMMKLEYQAMKDTIAHKFSPKHLRRNKEKELIRTHYMDDSALLERIRKEQLRIDTIDNEVRRTDTLVFKDVKHASDFLSQECAPAMKRTTFMLSTKARWRMERVEEALFDGVRKLKSSTNATDVAMSENFLIAVLGGSGLGKTDTLHHIRQNSKVQAKINALVRCQHCVPLFASFDQRTPYDENPYDPTTEPNVTAALCNLLLSDYLGVACNKHLTCCFEKLTLRDIVSFVRECEAATRKCAPSAVCITILVDEVRRLDADRTKKLCDELLAVQHFLISAALPTFAVVGSLEVDSVFATITRSSGHRLHPIPLYIDSNGDRDEFAFYLNQSCKVKSAREWSSHIHATGWNFRLLQNIWTNPWYDMQHDERCRAYIREIVARQLRCAERKCWMKESELMGSALSSAPSPITLHDVISMTNAVYYKEVDLNASPPMVRPCVAQLAVEGCDDALLRFAILTLSKRNLFTLMWSKAVPLLEAVATKLMREANGDQPVPLNHLYHEVFVQHWDAQNPLSLTYTASCKRIESRLIDDVQNDASQNIRDVIDVSVRTQQAAVCSVRSRECTVGGVHTLLEVPSREGESSKLVPVVFQISRQKVGCDANLAMLANRAHAHATLHLGLQPGSYFVALYVMWPSSKCQKHWKDSIPRGTIVIDATSMERVMEAFGVDAPKLLLSLNENDDDEGDNDDD